MATVPDSVVLCGRIDLTALFTARYQENTAPGSRSYQSPLVHHRYWPAAIQQWTPNLQAERCTVRRGKLPEV